MRTIDLNADMGEYADDAQRHNEEALMALISSCSIACGGHAGDEETMTHIAEMAKRHRVSIGAHPSYPDRVGFGRRSLKFDSEELRASLVLQIDSLRAVLNREGAPLRHIKPHGALYNDAAKDASLAKMIAEVAGDAILVGPPGSMLEKAANDRNKKFAAEGFVDRLYQQSGALTPRGQAGAVIGDIPQRAEQASAIARGATFRAADGTLSLIVQTLCIHSDSPGAVETAKAVRQRLTQDGFEVKAFS
ncbi:5-oxoprolinase subunit PxpA [Hyphococcus flavus]|uniref:5-oxoprolinase subunit PxpA n=1 Tax=Hyphococcus flavus TaxID=1866326 RepID=A0AAE9ZFT1_9PROT|nr:5-oxoprolinase subunit PxpA [Hyphococcus flavus]WDI33050.1 5-oxoprolinase subunit PxpA [Hyphococcus flavus]